MIPDAAVSCGAAPRTTDTNPMSEYQYYEFAAVDAPLKPGAARPSRRGWRRNAPRGRQRLKQAGLL